MTSGTIANSAPSASWSRRDAAGSSSSAPRPPRRRSGGIKCLEKTGKSNPDIQIVFVLGMPVLEAENPALGEGYVRKTLAPLGARVVYYEEMIENANKAYSEYLEQSKKMDKLDAILDQIK